MTKKVENIAKDIKELLRGVHTGSHEVRFDSPEFLGKFGLEVAKAFKKTVAPEDKERPAGTFYASEIGSKCYRQLWYKYHKPSLAETRTSSMSMKYLYGNIIEEVVLNLAELAGHKITHKQESVEFKINGITIRGRVDAVVNEDQAVIDVKSTSSYGFKDFKAGTGGDKFGYKEQLGFYWWHLKPTPQQAGFLVVDKQLGHIEYCPQEIPSYHAMESIYRQLGLIVDAVGAPIHVRLPTVAEGSNQKLGLECSYCAYKNACWKDANDGHGLRAFQYSNKVMWLTKVNKEPKVPEITGAVLLGDTEDD